MFKKILSAQCVYLNIRIHNSEQLNPNLYNAKNTYKLYIKYKIPLQISTIILKLNEYKD